MKAKRKSPISKPASKVRLGEIAYARSGDKGSGATVGVFAHTAKGYDFLKRNVTTRRVETYFKRMGVGHVVRYDVSNLGAFNFVLPRILAGGGSRSLRIDAQGKTLGQAMLEIPLTVPAKLL